MTLKGARGGDFNSGQWEIGGMAIVRRALGFPFYFLAFVLHLLTAFFAAIAQKVAGDESEPSRTTDVILGFALGSVLIIFLWFLGRPVPDTMLRLGLHAPMESWRHVEPNFHPDQLVWVKPMIRISACIFAQRVIRHQVEPDMVDFEPCREGGKIQTMLTEDLMDATVTGVAMIERQERHFVVTLQHYPPSVSEGGFIATKLQIEDGVTQIASCASAE
jgi:hypothetical protein